MMELSFKTDNDAFDSDDPHEVVRILRLVASQIERGSHEAPILDINGTTVGSWRLGRR